MWWRSQAGSGAAGIVLVAVSLVGRPQRVAANVKSLTQGTLRSAGGILRDLCLLLRFNTLRGCGAERRAT